MTIDKLLDIIIPVDFGLQGKNEVLRRGVKLVATALIMVVIVITAVSATLDLCPEGLADWCVWVMVAWRIFMHTVVYCVVVVIFMALNGTLREVFDGGEKSVPTPAKNEKSASADEPALVECEYENVFFSHNIDEEALIRYIKSHPDKFTSGEDMGIFYLIMSDKKYISPVKKRFHDFLSSLIDCKGFSPFSCGCLRVKEILDYTPIDETRRRLIVKYEEMEKIIEGFVMW